MSDFISKGGKTLVREKDFFVASHEKLFRSHVKYAFGTYFKRILVKF